MNRIEGLNVGGGLRPVLMPARPPLGILEWGLLANVGELGFSDLDPLFDGVGGARPVDMFNKICSIS